MNTMLFFSLGGWITFDFFISLSVILEIELFIFSTNFPYPLPASFQEENMTKCDHLSPKTLRVFKRALSGKTDGIILKAHGPL